MDSHFWAILITSLSADGGARHGRLPAADPLGIAWCSIHAAATSMIQLHHDERRTWSTEW
eukprot:16439611-Heterocapsa_arctica.AAC.1